MRKQAVRPKTFGRLSAFGEAAAHADDLGADGRTRRQTLLRTALMLASAFSLSWAIYWSAHVRTHPSGHESMIASLSADELFGFGSAAIAACRSTGQITWEQLSRSVSSADDGAVSQGVSRGFAAFAELKTQLGDEAACSASVEAISARTTAH